MKILAVNLQNFMNIKEAHLQFQDGINVLYGDNGQGKSSVFEAIAYCLTDQKRGDTWKDYVKIGEKFFDIQMTIQLSDILDDVMIFHYRGLKSKGSVDKEITYKDEIHQGEDTSNFLGRMFDQDMLRNTAFLLQDTTPITKMKPSERRDIFKKIFNSDFPEAIKKITEDQKAIDTEITQIKIRMDLLQRKEYKLFRIIEINEVELESLRKELQDSQASELDKEKYKFYSEKVKELNDKQTELGKLIQSKDSHLKQIDIHQKNLQNINEEFNTISVELHKLNHDLNNKTMIVQINERSKEKHENSFKISEYEENKKIWTASNIKTLAEIKLYERYIETHKKGLCENCGQKCDPSNIPVYDEEIHKLKMIVDTIDKKIEEIDKAGKDYQLKCAEWISKVYESKRELTAFITMRDNSNTKIKNLEEKIKLIKESQIPREQELINVIDTNIISFNEKITTLQKWCDENKIEAKSSTRPALIIQKEMDDILAQIQKNIVEARINENTLKEKESDKKELSQHVLVLNDLQLKSENYVVVKKIYEVDFPSYINLQACQILQDYMNIVFQNTKSGFNVYLHQDNKGINFFYKAAAEPEWNSSKMTSGFESSLLTIGFKTAVGFAYGSDFIILDEIDAKASDKSSEKLFKVITSLNGFKQMFIVTHKEVAMEYMKENGASIYKVENGIFESVTY